MNRFVLGVVILAVFLALGLGVAWGMNGMHLDVSDNLSLAARQVISGDWETGVSLAKKAKADWENNWQKTACVADHAPMDEIDGLFAQLQAFENPEEAVHYASVCAQLSKLVEAMAEAHQFSWWNLL